MEISSAEIIKAAENLLYNIHMGQWQKIYNICKNNVLWKYNHNYFKGIADKNIINSLNTIIAPSEILKFEHIKYFIYRLSQNHILITGFYCIHKSVSNSTIKLYFDYTIIFSNGLTCYIHIIGNDIPTKIHRIVSVTEAVYNMQEDEILYIEAMGDHILWHCRNTVIESTDSLKKAGNKLSKDFVRVHRSYMVNKKVVKSIQRCSATLINGDVIPIPYKKYVNVRKQLTEE